MLVVLTTQTQAWQLRTDIGALRNQVAVMHQQRAELDARAVADAATHSSLQVCWGSKTYQRVQQRTKTKNMLECKRQSCFKRLCLEGRARKVWEPLRNATSCSEILQSLFCTCLTSCKHKHHDIFPHSSISVASCPSLDAV